MPSALKANLLVTAHNWLLIHAMNFREKGAESRVFCKACSQATLHQSSAGADWAPASAGSPEGNSLVLHKDQCQDRVCRGQRSVRMELNHLRTRKGVFGSIQMGLKI